MCAGLASILLLTSIGKTKIEKVGTDIILIGYSQWVGIAICVLQGTPSLRPIFGSTMIFPA